MTPEQIAEYSCRLFRERHYRTVEQLREERQQQHENQAFTRRWAIVLWIARRLPKPIRDRLQVRWVHSVQRRYPIEGPRAL